MYGWFWFDFGALLKAFLLTSTPAPPLHWVLVYDNSQLFPSLENSPLPNGSCLTWTLSSQLEKTPQPTNGQLLPSCWDYVCGSSCAKAFLWDPAKASLQLRPCYCLTFPLTSLAFCTPPVNFRLRRPSVFYHHRAWSAKTRWGNSPVVPWLGLCTLTAEDTGLIPGWGTKIPQAMWCGQSKKFF